MPIPEAESSILSHQTQPTLCHNTNSRCNIWQKLGQPKLSSFWWPIFWFWEKSNSDLEFWSHVTAFTTHR